MFADCHMHMILDGVYYRAAIDHQKYEPDEALIRARLTDYAARGITYLRDGGDGWGVGLRASQLAEEYGIAYRTLYNSGVDYLVFRIGEECVAFKTEGFTAGSEFTRLKAAGVSTKKFDYSMTLTADKAGEFPLEMRFSVSVENEGETMVYDLTDDDTMEMYYYDVQQGGVDMLDVAFGAYVPAIEEGDMTNE